MMTLCPVDPCCAVHQSKLEKQQQQQQKGMHEAKHVASLSRRQKFSQSRAIKPKPPLGFASLPDAAMAIGVASYDLGPQSGANTWIT